MPPWPGSAELIQTYLHRKSGRLRPEEILARVGVHQHRLVTTAQCHAVGWSDRVLSARVLQGRLHKVFAEVYSLGGPVRTDRERWMACVLTFGDAVGLSHTPGAELYGWLRYRTGQLHVTTPTKRDPRDGIIPHHRSRPVQMRFIDGIPVTTPEQTILDCASTIRSGKAYRRIIRQAQVDKHTTHARLLAFAAVNRGARGVARLKAELADGPSPTRSGNEDRVLDLIRHGGEPKVNYMIGNDEFDLVYLDQRIIIEIDGPSHDNPTAATDDAAKQTRAEAHGFTLYRLH